MTQCWTFMKNNLWAQYSYVLLMNKRKAPTTDVLNAETSKLTRLGLVNVLLPYAKYIAHRIMQGKAGLQQCKHFTDFHVFIYHAVQPVSSSNMYVHLLRRLRRIKQLCTLRLVRRRCHAMSTAQHDLPGSEKTYLISNKPYAQLGWTGENCLRRTNIMRLRFTV